MLRGCPLFGESIIGGPTCNFQPTQAAISMLKHEYKEMPTLEEALQLAIKVLNKTLDSTKLSAEKGRLYME